MPFSQFLRRFPASLFLLLFTVGLPTKGWTHDYWFAPEKFYIPGGLEFRTKMFVGGDFKPEKPRPLRVDITEKLELHSHGKSPVDLLSSTSKTKEQEYTKIKVAKPRAYWLITERAPTLIELEPKKFENYLSHENLGHIVEQRRQANETKKIGRESYTRSIKTYISVGNHSDKETWKMRIPQRIEIYPKVDPRSIQSGQEVSFEVLFESTPLVNVAVSAMHIEEGSKKAKILSSQTDKNGRVTFKLGESGSWLIRLVHMQRCKDCINADWESFWGALTIGVQKTKTDNW